MADACPNCQGAKRIGPSQVQCHVCVGTGVAPYVVPEAKKCGEYNGSGRAGFETWSRACKPCRGSGLAQHEFKMCVTCSGCGSVDGQTLGGDTRRLECPGCRGDGTVTV